MAESLTEKRERTRKAVEKPAVQYRTLKKTMENSYNIKWKSDEAAKRDFFNLYDKEISEFIDAHHDEYGQQQAAYTTKWFDFSEKYEVLVKDYLEMFRGQKRFGLNDSVSEDERKKNVRNDDAKKRAEALSIYRTGVTENLKAGGIELAGQDEEGKLDDKVSDGAKQGVREISKWLYRNCSRRGAGIAGHYIGDDHSKFVRLFVMSQPMRVKLLGFYLIEKKKRKQPDMVDIMASQVGYEPNLEEFKSAMTATKWKFWMRLDGSYIYWDKLSEGMRKAQSYRDALENYASLGEVEPPSESEQEQVPEEEKQTEQGTVAAPKYDHDKLAKSAQKRKVAFDVFIAAAARHREILEGKKSKDEKLVSDSAHNVEEHLKILAEVDDEVLKNGGVTYTNKAGDFDAEQANKKTNDGSIKKTSEEKQGIADTIASAATAAFEKAGTAVSTIADKGSYVHWNIGELSKVKMTKADGGLNLAGNVSSLISGLLAIAALTRNASHETAGEIAQKCFEITSNMASIAESATGNVYKIKNAGEIAAGIDITESGALTHAAQAEVYAGIVSGAVNTTLGVYQLAKANNHRKDIKSGSEDLSTMETDEANKGKIARITNLASRKLENEELSGTANVIGGALQLVGGILDATVVGAGIGTIFNGIGSAITLTTSVAMYFKNKSDRKQTIDEYIGLEKPIEGTGAKESLLDKILKICKNAIEGTEWSETKKALYMHTIVSNLDQIKDMIREDVTAMLGYASPQAFYDAIIDEYAEFLYAHAFYKNGVVKREEMVLAKDVAEGKCKKEEAYAKLLNGMGIKVKYPEDNDGEPNVDVENISTKIKG